MKDKVWEGCEWNRWFIATVGINKLKPLNKQHTIMKGKTYVSPHPFPSLKFPEWI